ncbi:MAG: hypothetical protein ACLFNM_03190 [Candidatus Woesearchaeota archaeon]
MTKVLLPRKLKDLQMAKSKRVGKKPSAFIDCDGVLRNTFPHVISIFMREYTYSRFSSKIQQFDYDLKSVIPDPVFCEFFPEKGVGKHTQEVFEDAPLIESDISSTLEQLSQTHDLYLVTAQKKEWQSFTLSFLKNNHIESFFSAIYFAPLLGNHGLKKDIYHKVGFDKNSFVIEDSPQNLLDAKNEYLRAIAFDQKYNTVWSGERITSLKDVVNNLTSDGVVKAFPSSMNHYWKL